MPFDPFSEPNPTGSPLEKIKISRRTPSIRDFASYLQREGVDPDTARRIGRAVNQWESEKHFENIESLIDMEMWANTHTHPGGTGGGTPGIVGTELIAGAGTTVAYVLKSTDGETWSEFSSSHGVSNIQWNPISEKYLARSSSDLVESSDGLSWTVLGAFTDNNVVKTPYWSQMGVWLGSGPQFERLTWALDPLGPWTWEQEVISTTTINYTYLNYNETMAIVRERQADATGWRTEDGKNWVSFSFGVTAYSQPMWTGSYWIMGGNDTTYAVSLDGLTWTLYSKPAALSYNGPIVTNGQGLAIVMGGNDIWVTEDGENWTNTYTSPRAVRDAFFDGARFVLVGVDGLVLISSDGYTWTDVSVTTLRDYTNITSNVTPAQAIGIST